MRNRYDQFGKALPADAPERRLALPLLVQYRLTAESEPAPRTPEDEEFLMDTADTVEMWRQLAVQEGVMQGFKEGLVKGLSQAHAESLERQRRLLLRMLRQRFGEDVDGATEQRLHAASDAQIEVWIERVLSAPTLAELLAH